MQISYRLDPIYLTLQEQSYFVKASEECGVPRLFGLDPYEQALGPVLTKVLLGK